MPRQENCGMRVYIVAPDDDITSVNRVNAWVGFAALGADAHWIEPLGLDDIALELGDIVVGGIGIAHHAFRRLGIPVPALPSIPPELMPFAQRRLWRDSIAAVRKQVEAGTPIFVKPVPEQHKLFNGQCLSSFRDLIATAHIPDDTQVDCAEPVAFVSEYRGFVLHGDLVGLRHYKGDPLVFPDAEAVRAAVRAFVNGPAGYALDFGVLADGRTAVVEINDGYASGAYGLPPITYANVITARWKELQATAAPTDPV
jgi:hypothetical protein